MQAACTCRPSHGYQATRARDRSAVGVKTLGPALSHSHCLEVLVPTLLMLLVSIDSVHEVVVGRVPYQDTMEYILYVGAVG